MLQWEERGRWTEIQDVEGDSRFKISTEPREFYFSCRGTEGGERRSVNEWGVGDETNEMN